MGYFEITCLGFNLSVLCLKYKTDPFSIERSFRWSEQHHGAISEGFTLVNNCLLAGQSNIMAQSV